jgi:hypothetical protein
MDDAETPGPRGRVTAANDLGLTTCARTTRARTSARRAATATPIGPALIDAARIDPANLRVRTWVNGELAGRHDRGLIFPLAQIVADLSQHFTLETGDVILTGTPAGSSVVVPGDVVEVQVDAGISSGRLRTTVVQGERAFDGAIGSLPAVDDRQRAEAWGSPSRRTQSRPGLTPALREALRVPVAALSGQLRKRGLNDVTIDGVRPSPGQKLRRHGQDPALPPPPRRPLRRTRRRLQRPEARVRRRRRARSSSSRPAAKPDQAHSATSWRSAPTRGAAAIVTDGGVRDADAVAAVGIPVFTAGAHPAVLGRRHVPWRPTSRSAAAARRCSRATSSSATVTASSCCRPPSPRRSPLRLSQEEEDAWIARQVASGHPVDGLFPMNAQWRARYEARGTPDATTPATSPEQVAAGLPLDQGAHRRASSPPGTASCSARSPASSG